MSDAYTTEQLIQLVRHRARLPNTSILGSTDADIIRVLNQRMHTTLIPGLMKPKEDYFMRMARVPLVSGIRRYKIPARAAGLKLQSLRYQDSNGNARKLDRIEAELASEYVSSSTTPAAFYVEGQWITLVPDVGSYSGYLLLGIFLRPGALVASTSYRTIAQVVSSTVVTLASDAPTDWGGGTLYDVHSAESGAECKVWNRTLDDLSGTQVTFSEAIDGSGFSDLPVAMGDYFVVAGTAAIPALPTELHVALGLLAAASLLMPLNPENAMAIQEEAIQAMRSAGYIVEPRVDSSPPSAGKSNPLYGERTKVFGR